MTSPNSSQSKRNNVFQLRLTTIPNFKETEGGQTLSKVKSMEKLKAEDFGKKKLELNINVPTGNAATGKQLDGMNSPRNAFNSDNVESVNGFGSSEKEEEHKIHILAYVDYSKKYGLGYLINNKQYGVYFNDETLMSTDS